MKKILNLLNLSPVMAVASLANIFIAGLGLYYFFSGQEGLLTRYTDEDGFIEWIQFILFTITSFLFALMAYIHFVKNKKKVLKILVLLGFAALFMVGALEEISWFQRVADIQASEFFLEHNRQNETNLHNLVVNDVNINKYIIVKLMFLFLLTHNLILPLIARKKKGLRLWIEERGFYLPSLGGVSVFLVLVILAETLVGHERKGEILETMSSIHYFSTVFAAYFVGDNYSSPLIQDKFSKKLANICFVFLLVFLIYISWILGNMSLKDFML